MRHRAFQNIPVAILASIMLQSCGNWIVPPELVGQWETDLHKITVRSEPEKGNFIFTSDSAKIVIKIKSDKAVTGFIGAAGFENGILKKNWGNPEKTGVAYIIKCGSIGKIFEIDPLINKDVQLWLSPPSDNIDAELRYTQGMAQFPMAGITITKTK